MFDHFTLNIDLGNAEMEAGPDVAEALRKVADRIENKLEARGTIMDANGNTVGEWSANNKPYGSRLMLPIARGYLRLYGNTADAVEHFVNDLMAGDPTNFKVGYSRENAILAAADAFGYLKDQIEGFCK